MTERIYYTDAYCTEFDAAVTALAELDGRPALILDRSAFYPTSGGQPYDTGALGDYAVVDVVAADGAVYHILDRAADPALVGQTIHGRIDRPLRCPTHAAAFGPAPHLAGLPPAPSASRPSPYTSADESTLDLDAAEVTPEQLDQAELLANDLVIRAIPIKTYFVGDAESTRFPCAARLVRTDPASSRSRALTGRPAAHACAHHRRDRRSFTRQQRMRGQARITFLCGRRALLRLPPQAPADHRGRALLQHRHRPNPRTHRPRPGAQQGTATSRRRTPDRLARLRSRGLTPTGRAERRLHRRGPGLCRP